MAPVAAAETVELEGNLTSLARPGGHSEWYLNGPLGIEHGFVLNTRPAGEGTELTIQLTVGGCLIPEASADGSRVTLATADGDEVLQYTDLFVDEAGSGAPSAPGKGAGAQRGRGPG